MHTPHSPSAHTCTPAPSLTSLPPGARHAGPVFDEAGQPQHHLVLLPDRPAGRLNWQAAKEWAASVSGDLPSPQEQALLFANCRDVLPKDWCWSNKEHERGASYAWYCYFTSGGQDGGHKSFEGSAVAVRRLVLESFDSSDTSAHACTPPAKGTFTHTPRPAVVAEAPHAHQRRFGPPDHSAYGLPTTTGQHSASVTVYRSAHSDAAELEMSIGMQTRAHIQALLTPDELREIAARLIDAAHDIETFPSSVLARQEGGAA